MYLRVGSVCFSFIRDHSNPHLPLKRYTEKWSCSLAFYVLISELNFFRKWKTYLLPPLTERFLCPINQEGGFQGLAPVAR